MQEMPFSISCTIPCNGSSELTTGYVSVLVMQEMFPLFSLLAHACMRGHVCVCAGACV